jgi:hypothetical protein
MDNSSAGNIQPPERPQTPPGQSGNPTLLRVQGTPIKPNNATMAVYTPLNTSRAERFNDMAAEIKENIVGPIEVTDFLKNFLPDTQIQVPINMEELDKLVGANSEKDNYDPFVSHFDRLTDLPSSISQVQAFKGCFENTTLFLNDAYDAI